jgi:hypothetical protein
MKKLLVFIIIAFCFIQVDAQYSKKQKDLFDHKFGIKALGGVVLSRSEITYIGNEADYVIHQVELNKTIPQKSFGFYGQKKFGWLYAEFNALYSSYGMEYNVKSYNIEGQPTNQLKESFGYVDLQVIGGLTSNGFRIGVGPVIHILANHSSELESLENFNQRFRNSSFGFSGTVGYDLGRLSFDLKYDKAFRSVGDHIYYGNKKSLFLETPDAITFSVGYAIIN